MFKMHIFRKLRVLICLLLISLMIAGKPICLTYECENGTETVATSVSDGIWTLHQPSKACNSTSLKCEKIVYGKLFDDFTTDNETAKRIFSITAIIVVIFSVAQIFFQFLASDSEVNEERICCFNFYELMFCFEFFLYATLITYLSMNGLTDVYLHFVLQHRVGYFIAVTGLYLGGLTLYLMEIFFYLIRKQPTPAEGDGQLENTVY